MKIAILTSTFLPNVGGAEVFVHNISKELSGRGNTVEVYIPREYFRQIEPRFRDRLIPLPTKFFGVMRRLPLLGVLWAHLYLIPRQRRERYDVWLAVRTFPSGYAATYLLPHVPVVVRASGEDIQKSTELNYGVRLQRGVETKVRNSVTSCDRVVAMTETARVEFCGLEVEDRKIVTISNGCRRPIPTSSKLTPDSLTTVSGL